MCKICANFPLQHDLQGLAGGVGCPPGVVLQNSFEEFWGCPVGHVSWRLSFSREVECPVEEMSLVWLLCGRGFLSLVCEECHMLSPGRSCVYGC